MRIAAHRGTLLHAPENSRAALISAYVAGADVLEFDLQLAKDGALILSHDGTTARVTGEDLKIIDTTLADLKKLDWSKTFAPRNSPGFDYLTGDRKLGPVTFPQVLDFLPDDVELLIELKHDSSLITGRREEFVKAALAGLRSFGAVDRTVVYSKDPENLKLLRALEPSLRIAAFDYEKSAADQLQLLRTTGADGLVTSVETIFANGQLNAFGNELREYCTTKKLKVGAILYPYRKPGVFTQAEFETLRKEAFIWSLSTDSMLDVGSFVRRLGPKMGTDFNGDKVDRENFAFGYAKANKYCEVAQNNGVHVKIDAYDGSFPPPSGDALERKVAELETKLLFAAKDWPYYSGGGLGYLHGIKGDFSAETTYLVEQVAQATTLEMAVLNVDPGAHVAVRPDSFRSKDSFYDPHGAPPYVGVEHDEDDGFRINWNLGSEYDNNQYGRPFGDGKTPRGAELRLDRRGPFFAAYYRNAKDKFENGANIGPGVWVCVGVTRNDSMNPVVYLRCVGKRWRQEKEATPWEFEPIIPNHFIFNKLSITRYL